MIISEFQLVDKLTPGEESGSMNLLSANEDDVLLVLTNRVVKVHHFTFPKIYQRFAFKFDLELR